MPINLPEINKPRIVIVGAGFAGITLSRKLSHKDYQIVIIDKNNFYQFQPLLYQVAMSGIEPSSIAFPLRRLFRRTKNVHIRVARLEAVEAEKKYIVTNEGRVNYDILVLATGVTTNFYGNTSIESNAYSLKSVSDALFLRNAILTDLEKALTERDIDKRKALIDLVIVGGGPTGVELAGSLAEMRKYILPREYPELNPQEMEVHLIQSRPDLLHGMSDKASEKSKEYLEELGVDVLTGVRVTGYDGNEITLNNGRILYSTKVIWAAGITGERIAGIPDHMYADGHRIKTNEFNQVIGYPDFYALGDNSYMEEGEYEGHPQVAQPAIQQARLLAKNLNGQVKGKPFKPFRYRDLGTMATIGRNKAIADLPYWKTQGFVAWILWLVVHLKSILGVRNKILVLTSWIWSYITMDQGLRILIRHKTRKPTQ
jgi:NADH dehydrogenase